MTKDGNIVVVDKDNHRIQVFKVDGTFLHAFGCHGNEKPEQLDSPSHVAITEDHGFLVTDAGNNRVVKFDSKGNHEFVFGRKGSATGEMDRPSGITVDSEGFIDRKSVV